jgi:large conductance mechanosensitive channel
MANGRGGTGLSVRRRRDYQSFWIRRSGGLGRRWAMVWMKEFREFLLKQNAIALAVGVIIGAAVGRVVSGLVEDVLMPIIGVLLPTQSEWRQLAWQIGASNSIKYGDLGGRVLDFIITAAVVFAITKVLLREKPKPAAPVKSCPECLETIPAAARRCRACAAPLLVESGVPLSARGGEAGPRDSTLARGPEAGGH